MKGYKLDENFIKTHQRIGMFLEFENAEKVLRSKVKSLPNRADLIKEGLKDNDMVISGAAVYHYKIK